jgi:outer membrane lipoprotein-sorting protein
VNTLKKIVYLVIAASLIIGFWIYHTSSGFAGEIYPLDNHEFTLTQLDENGAKQEFSIRIDKNGHFYSEIKSGARAGNFELWDGKKFYRYDKSVQDLWIDQPPAEGKVIAHPFLSEVVNSEISEDLKSKELKKQLFSSVYQKQYENEENDKVIERIQFDNKLNHPVKYTMEIDGEQVSSIEISNVKELDQSITAEAYIDIEELKNEGVHISE